MILRHVNNLSLTIIILWSCNDCGTDKAEEAASILYGILFFHTLPCLAWALELEMGWVSSNPFSISEPNKRLIASAKPVPHPPVFHLETAIRSDVQLAPVAVRSSSARTINRSRPLERPRFSVHVPRAHHTPPKFRRLTHTGVGRHPEQAANTVTFARTVVLEPAA